MPDGNTTGSWADRYLPGSEALASNDPTDTVFTLANLRGIIFRQRLMLFGVVVTTLVVGLVFTLLTKPTYEATATIRVDPTGVNIVEGQDLAPTLMSNEIARYMNTQGSVIKSKHMADAVIDALKLDTNPAFLDDVGPKPAGVSSRQWSNQRREMAAAVAQRNVTVTIPTDNRVISINYTSPSPNIASMLANGYADAYVKEDVRRGFQNNEYARSYLRGQIKTIGAQLQIAERKSNAYAKVNRIVGSALVGSSTSKTSSDGPSETITAANLASVNATYTKARTDRIAAEQRWRAIAQLPASQLPEVQQNATVQDMQAERAKVSASIAELRLRYGATYPQLREMQAQLANLDSQIARVSNDIKNSISNQYQIATRQAEGLSTELQKVADQTLDEQDRRVEYNQLDRQATALRTQLASLLERYNQLSAAANINSGSTSKLDNAVTPSRPVSPDLVKNMLVAFVLGIGLAVALAVLREAFDDRVRSSDDVERKLGTSLLGMTPYLEPDDVAKAMANPLSSLMESYSSLRTSVDFAVAGRHRVLQVTSSQPAEGKSLTSSAIARKYAQLGRKTLLIDADLRKPSVNNLFNAKRSEKGLAEVVLGDITLEDAILDGTPDNLDVLPVGALPANPVELLSSKRMSDFIEQCRQVYEMIIIDSSPVMGLADAPLISRYADGVIFIVESNRSHFGQAKAALRRLRTAGANVLGTVLTKYQAASAGLAYDDQYSYYSYGSEDRNK